MFQLIEGVEPIFNLRIRNLRVFAQLLIEKCQLLFFRALIYSCYVKLEFLFEICFYQISFAYTPPTVYGDKFRFVGLITVM